MEKSDITVAQLIRELRKPGKVTMPVIHAEGVTHIAVEKADLIAELEEFGLDSVAPWCVYHTYENGTRRLDINE